jgi:hypothetical protein
LGRPGEHPQGFGVAAGEPSAHNSRGNPRRTRQGRKPRRGRGISPTAAVGRRRPRGPGAAGRRQPAPARSTGRPERDAAAVGHPAEGLLVEPDGVLQVEPTDIGPPDQIEITAAGAGPPQPQHLGWTRPSQYAPNLDAQDGPTHDRPRPAAAVARVALLLECSPVHALTVTVCAGRPGRSEWRSGRLGGRVGAVELGPVATRPAGAAGWPWWRAA